MKLRMILVLMILMLVALFALPAMAQDTGVNNVSFNDFSFSFDSSLAANVDISQFAGDPVDLEQPGGPEAPHTQFILYNDRPAPESFLDAPAAIRVYQTINLANYPNSAAQFEQLRTLVAEQGDLTPFMTITEPGADQALPFLPVFPAAQVIRARAQFVSTPTFQGIGYVTVYRQDVSPFVGSEFFYTVQGVSGDGAYYVSALFRLNTDLFPAEIPPDFNYEDFTAEFSTYLTESITTLNDAEPDAFTPGLAMVGATIQTFAFGSIAAPDGEVPVATLTPVPTATEVNQDPSLGGLVGTWNLVSFGAPEAQQPVLPNAPITITFSEAGVGGRSGCNSFGGVFQYNAGALTFSNLISTLIACEEAVNIQEAAFLAALTAATSYQINGSQLLINYPGGVLTFVNAAATLTPSAPAVLATPTATP